MLSFSSHLLHVFALTIGVIFSLASHWFDVFTSLAFRYMLNLFVCLARLFQVIFCPPHRTCFMSLVFCRGSMFFLCYPPVVTGLITLYTTCVMFQDFTRLPFAILYSFISDWLIAALFLTSTEPFIFVVFHGTYILLDVLVYSIAVEFYELCCILTSP